MDNTIEFPAKEVRDLAKVEKLLRKGMRDAGISKEAEDIVTADLLELVKKYNSMYDALTTVTLPGTLNQEEIEACKKALNQVGEDGFQAYNKVMNEVLIDLGSLRLELYIARGD